MAARVQHQDAYILQTRPYSESSWLIDAFSKNYGRVSLLAKGARRLKSKVRGLIRPFQPLLLSWSGKGELQTLTGAEANLIVPQIDQQSWLCASYMNELLIKLMHRHDPHEKLFNNYGLALQSLRDGQSRQIVLRIFEKQLLSEIGYGLLLERDTANQKISAEKTYHYYPNQGPTLVDRNHTGSVWLIKGSTLIALDNEVFNNAQEIEQSKHLMRALLNQSMQGRDLKSRLVLQNINSVS